MVGHDPTNGVEEPGNPFPAPATDDVMETLMDSVAGRYLVETEASTYALDLDKMTFTRAPHEEDPTASQLRKDNETVDLLEISSCTVGAPMVLILDLHVPMVAFTVRQATIVQSIRSLSQAVASQ